MTLGLKILPIGILFARLLAEFFCLFQGIETALVVWLKEHAYPLGNPLLLGYARWMSAFNWMGINGNDQPLPPSYDSSYSIHIVLLCDPSGPSAH